jgi:hypothetical protein
VGEQSNVKSRLRLDEPGWTDIKNRMSATPKQTFDVYRKRTSPTLRLAVEPGAGLPRNGAHVMGFTKQRDIDLDEIDQVTAFSLRLAIGLMVLGSVFAALDRWDLLPHVAPPQQLSKMTADKATL